MTLINSSLLLGLILAGIPLILHLVMRAKPKRIEFPALRLLKARQPSNARRMRLRQILLLALRVLLICTLVVAIARPSLPAANYGLRWWEWAGVGLAAGLSGVIYVLMGRRDAASQSAAVNSVQRRSRQKVLCLLMGLLMVILLTGIPWGLRVRAELLSPRNEGTEDVPVAAVFLIDNSISMNYRQENLTRMEAASQLAKQLLERFPSGSRAAVASSEADEEIIFQADLSGTSSRMEAMEVTAVPGRLNRQIQAAIKAQVEDRRLVQEQAGLGGSADLFARDIYVLSDFSRASLQIPDENGLADLLTQLPWLHIYLVDVSVPAPVNAGITQLTLSDESTVTGRDLVLSMSIASTQGLPAMATVETSLIDASGQEVRSGAPVLVKLDGNAARIQSLIKITGAASCVEGVIRLTAEDPLMDDNVRYFSCGVRPAPKVLLIADRPEESLYLKNALQPEELERAGVRLCQCVSIPTASAAEQTLTGFDAVFLVGIQRPDESLWNALAKYLQNGGGVFVVAGSSRIQPGTWSTPAARQLLPATPLTIVRFLNEPGQLKLAPSQHPVLRDFYSDEALRVELGAAAFDKCWAVENLPDTTTLMTFTGPGARPALLERKVGAGRCLMFTSAMDNLPEGGSQWNNLVTSWAFLVLADELLAHLTDFTSLQRNFISGTILDFPVPPTQRFEQFLLRRPGLRQTRGKLEADQSSVLLTDVSDQGHYLLKPFESPSSYEAAFSVNFPDEETDLTRIPDDQLQSLATSDHLTIIRQPEDLQNAVRASRLGVEVFPVLLGLVILLFCAEHIMSNFFYDEAVSSPAT
ncbi:MAG: BatA domain-containing protein [bacterium]